MYYGFAEKHSILAILISLNEMFCYYGLIEITEGKDSKDETSISIY